MRGVQPGAPVVAQNKSLSRSKRERLRVYLVEDSPIIVNLLRDLLSGEAELEIVGQAAEARVAVAEMADRMPDVAIVDIALAHGTGFDVLRGLALHGDVRPVVAMLSNYSSQRYRDEARKLGADYFFDKNGEIIKLVRTITNMATSGGHGAAGSRPHPGH